MSRHRRQDGFMPLNASMQLCNVKRTVFGNVVMLIVHSLSLPPNHEYVNGSNCQEYLETTVTILHAEAPTNVSQFIHWFNTGSSNSEAICHPKSSLPQNSQRC